MCDVTYKITQIETQKKDPDRVSIYLEGAFAFGLEREVILRHHLHEGDEITEHEIDEILLVEERARAKKKALSYLNYRARSTKELERKLLDKGFSERTVHRVIDDFSRVGLLDDSQFATAYVHSKMLQKPMGKRLLRKELWAMGIDEATIERTIGDVYGQRSEADVAREMVQKRMQRFTDIEPGSKKVKKKLTDFLLRRGFDWDVIAEVIHNQTWEADH
jgi:regulatory protein